MSDYTRTSLITDDRCERSATRFKDIGNASCFTCIRSRSLTRALASQISDQVRTLLLHCALICRFVFGLRRIPSKIQSCDTLSLSDTYHDRFIGNFCGVPTFSYGSTDTVAVRRCPGSLFCSRLASYQRPIQDHCPSARPLSSILCD